MVDKVRKQAYDSLPFSFFSKSDMPEQRQPSRPALIVTLLEMRRVLNRLAEQFDWDSEMLSMVAELQALMTDAFRGAKRLILQAE